MEGMAKCTQRPTTMWHQLLGDVCTSHYLANYPLLLRIGNHQGLVNPPNRLRVGIHDRIPSTTPGAEPPRDARDSGSARSHSTHLETSSSDRP